MMEHIWRHHGESFLEHVMIAWTVTESAADSHSLFASSLGKAG